MPFVLTERHGPDSEVFVVTIRRKEKHNAVDLNVAQELFSAFQSFENDPSAKVAVLCGDGESFCSGADLSSVQQRLSAPSPVTATSALGPMGPSRMQLSKPVIAAIAGYAVAGGLELALWCDLRVAEESAVLGVFCRRFGVPLIDGGTVRLAHVVGQGRALDLILTGRPVTAQEALQMGLVSRVVRNSTCRAEAIKLALEIAAFPQQCMQADRLSCLNNSRMTSTDLALRHEYVSAAHVLTAESVTGAKRFLSGAGRHGAFENGSSASRAASSQPPPPSRRFRAVIFDLGGVVFDSPFAEITKYEEEVGIAKGSLNLALASTDLFRRLECGEILVEDFAPLFDAECRSKNLPAAINGLELMRRITRTRLRRHFIAVMRRLRQLNYKVGVITNDVKYRGPQPAIEELLAGVVDVLVRSSVVGVNKPAPVIYQLAVHRLGVPAADCVFLDDIPRNLKAAAGVGMATIHVAAKDADGLQALQQLAALIGEDLQLPAESKL